LLLAADAGPGGLQGFQLDSVSRPGRLACRRADSESGSELDSESDWPKPAWQPSCPLPVRLVTQRRRNHWHRADSEDDPSPRLSPACSDCASCRRIPVVLAPRPVTGRPPRACPAHRRHRGPAAAAIGRAGPFRFRRVNAVCSELLLVRRESRDDGTCFLQVISVES
jgi:hypothetical protein